MLDFLGFIWASSSLWQMGTLMDYDKYQYMFHGALPDALILARYAGSWAQRALGLAAGIGLMAHQRWAATVLKFLSIYSIATVFWKHPLEAVEKHCELLGRLLDPVLASHGFPDIHVISFASQSAIFLRVMDVLFFGYTIYYLTRPKTKAKLG